MIEANITGIETTVDNIRHVASVTPGRAAGAMNDSVKEARKTTVRRLAARTGLSQRLLGGTTDKGRGGHIKRTVARARRPKARLVGLVAGVRLARAGMRHLGKSPMNMPPSVAPRVFWQRTRSGHRGVFARYPLPSRRRSISASSGTRRPNLPIKEVVIQLYPAARAIMTETMDYVSRQLYPRFLWQRLERAIVNQVKRNRMRK